MSISPANSDHRLGDAARLDPAAPPVGCARDEGLLSALASVPDFTFANGAAQPADRNSDDRAQLATISPRQSPTLPAPAHGEGLGRGAGEGRVGGRDRGRSQTIAYIPPAKRQIPPLDHGDEIPPFGLSPASVTVMSNRGYVGLGTPTPTARRRGPALARLKKSLVMSAIAATVAGCVAVEIWLLVGDSGLPHQASHRPLPNALPPELTALMTEAERIARAASEQPAVSVRPTVHTESQPAESRVEAPSREMEAGSERERIVDVDNIAAMPEPPRLAIPRLNPISRPEPPATTRLEPAPMTAPEPPSIAMPESTPGERVASAPITTAESTPIARAETTPITTPEPSSIATSESAWMARLGPPLESPRINHAAPRIAKAADRAGFLFADSNVRYLTRAELQKLSGDDLHVARNEIFARRGRFFKDDALRVYFSQFPWYRPHAWEVPLSPVEQANVALIQSVEQGNVGLAQSSEAPVDAFRSIAGPLPARAASAAGVPAANVIETNAENDAPFADPSSRYLTAEELQGLSADQLAIVRNEVFARRGRYFKDEWLRTYFSQFPWYQPYAWDVPLNPIDQANVKLVQSLEQATAPRPALRAR